MTELAPKTENRTLRRLPNAAYRSREYLTEAEVEKLIDTARKRGRNGLRDSAAILLAYRHGLRAQELCSLKWTSRECASVTWSGVESSKGSSCFLIAPEPLKPIRRKAQCTSLRHPPVLRR